MSIHTELINGLISENEALEAQIEKLRDGLFTLKIASCTCMTKTPELKYHNVLCIYRRAASILETDDKLKS